MAPNRTMAARTSRASTFGFRLMPMNVRSSCDAFEGDAAGRPFIESGVVMPSFLRCAIKVHTNGQASITEKAMILTSRPTLAGPMAGRSTGLPPVNTARSHVPRMPAYRMECQNDVEDEARRIRGTSKITHPVGGEHGTAKIQINPGSAFFLIWTFISSSTQRRIEPSSTPRRPRAGCHGEPSASADRRYNSRGH